MKFTIVKEPVPYVIIDDFYEPEELDLINRELEFTSTKLKDPEDTGSAFKADILLKNNKGVFLDELYRFREFSDILRLNRRLFSQEVVDELINCNFGFTFLKYCTYDTTLLSYYDNDDYYEPHTDICFISAVTWFHKQPKNFTGGEFVFTDYNISIEPKNNRCVIFFSFTKHNVTPIKIINNTVPASGRFSLTQFISAKIK